ncbi:RtcB family protein [Virgibacillus sp. C22-A2]|uniref:3'-phosphate/5'-hydroxy nucleic acid ligase n=1 Tax=Virgibacillus tibetensis TaxID=3042313 RepID=A0ABU6KDG2_9BACI|nr:RtcB family protein [Virgibacillus sp. C22-A2]
MEIPNEQKLNLLNYFGVCAGHFLEIRAVEDIYDKKIYEELGLVNGQLLIIIHSGAMTGKDILLENYYYKAIDYVVHNKLFEEKDIYEGVFGIPIQSRIGKSYLQAAIALINYSYASRHYSHYLIESLFKKHIDAKSSFELISDICHSKIISNDDGSILHARGLQTLYPAQHEHSLEPFKKTGDIGLLAGEKGTSSHLVVPKNNIKNTDYQCSHGTGKFNNPGKIDELPQYVHDDIKATVFDTEYDIENMLLQDFLNTKTTLNTLENEFEMIKPVVRLAPFINFWGEKNTYN